MASWLIYRGERPPHDEIERLPAPPPWRRFAGTPVLAVPPADSANLHQAMSYRPDPDVVEQVNAALYLRRPLLVSGRPGTGKSTLAYSVAYELGLGPVLHWPITSRVTLRDGLYQYDPLGRLYAASRAGPGAGAESGSDIGRYIRLGPLGTALLPYPRPRVLLIDEIDKSDIDLPNDLLTIFEKGAYEIPEVARTADAAGPPAHEVMAADQGVRVRIPREGTVRCRAFPLVVLTSNGEREFPPAFLRRCITLELREPGRDKLAEIVRSHLGDLADRSDDLIDLFLRRQDHGTLATDQLLHAVYLTHEAAKHGTIDRAGLAAKIMPLLSADADRDED